MKLSSSLGLSAGLALTSACNSRNNSELVHSAQARTERYMNVKYPEPLVVSDKIAEQIAASFLEASDPSSLVDPTTLCDFIGQLGMTREQFELLKKSDGRYELHGNSVARLKDVSEDNPYGTNLTLHCHYYHGDFNNPEEELAGNPPIEHHIENLSAVELIESQPANPDGEWERYVSDHNSPSFSLIQYAGGGIAVSLTGSETGTSWKVDNIHDYIATPGNQIEYQENLVRLRNGLEAARLDCSDPLEFED